MIRKVIVSGVAAMLALGGTAVAGVGPADAATPSWRLGYFDHTNNSYLGALSISSTHNAWSVGALPAVARWNGSSWHAVKSPDFHTKNYVFYNAVSTASASDTWIAGDTANGGVTPVHAVAAHWYRGKWFTHVLGTGGDIAQVSVFASDNVWLLGAVGNTGAYWHWNGKTWSQGRLPGRVERFSNSRQWARATSAGGKGVLLHYVSGHWHAVTSLHVALPKNAANYGVADTVQRSANDVYVAVGFRTGPPNDTTRTGLSLYHWNGHTWTRVIYLPQDSPGSMTNDGFGGLWILSSYSYGDDRVIDIRAGKVVHARKTPTFGVNTLYVSQLTLRPGTRTLWAAGGTEHDIDDTHATYYAVIAALGVN